MGWQAREFVMQAPHQPCDDSIEPFCWCGSLLLDLPVGDRGPRPPLRILISEGSVGGQSCPSSLVFVCEGSSADDDTLEFSIPLWWEDPDLVDRSWLDPLLDPLESGAA